MKDIDDAVAELVEECRSRCLWFLRPDYVPGTREEILRTMDLIERYGDRDGYRRAEQIKTWLLRDSRETS